MNFSKKYGSQSGTFAKENNVKHFYKLQKSVSKIKTHSEF